VPELSGLKLLRTVLGIEYVNIVVGFNSIPSGAIDQWKKLGYKGVDLVFRASRVEIKELERSAVIRQQTRARIVIEGGLFTLYGDAQTVLLQLSFGELDAEFIPDPFMQKFQDHKDRAGTDLEPGMD
jgi:hypothetical protein